MDPSLSLAHNIHTLTAAVEDGDLSKVQILLDQNVSVESTDDDGNSLLNIAAANGHEDVVKLLSIKGASLDRTNLYGWTPLMQAARYGHEDVALYLLSNNAKINAKTPMGVTALTLAIYGGHSKMVDLLLNNNQLVLDDAESISYFTSPLVVATMYGRDDALRTLLRRGLPPNQNFKFTEWTALMIAALTGQLPMARLLVDKGAQTNFKNRLGKTALEIATDCEKREVRGYLDRKTSLKPERVAEKGDNIITAVKTGDYPKVANILNNDKAQANKSSSDGATPLMYASITGQLRMIELLIECGADIDARDYENGWTALMQATYYGKTQAAIVLIRYGANVHIQACNGVTAFDMAMLINLTDTTLFRLLAEKVMQGKNDTEAKEPGQLTKAWTSTGSSGSILLDAQNQSKKSTALASPSSTTGSKRTFWSKMTRTMRGMKLTRTFKNSILPNKAATAFEETLIAPNEEDQYGTKKYDAAGANTVTLSDPYAMTNHSAPTTHFPTDKLSPVVPPFQTTTGVDKQNMTTQRKLSSSKTSISNSLNSSGESSVSRSVVRPFKFLHSPNSSGRYNSNGSAGNNNSPHSSGGATSVTHNFTTGDRRNLPGGVSEPHNRSGDRYSDTVLATMAKKRQRGKVTSPASVDGSMMRSSTSSDHHSHETQQRSQTRTRAGSHAGSIASSENTSSTITPPRSHRGGKMSAPSSRRSKSIKSGPRSSYQQPPLSEEDELTGILKQLELEKYHPIFEQQEIDMDAFLTLTQGDLSELGITQELPRQQILQAINQINVGKVKETPSGGGSVMTSAIKSDSGQTSRRSSDVSQRSWSYNQPSLPHMSS